MRFILPVAAALVVMFFLYERIQQEPTCEVFSYKTRPGEEASLAYVCKVEDLEGIGRVYHLYIDGLKVKNPEAKGEKDAIAPVISHLPITEAAFQKSGVKKVRDDAPMPPYQAGYEKWHAAYKDKQATAFDIPILMCVELSEKSRE